MPGAYIPPWGQGAQVRKQAAAAPPAPRKLTDRERIDVLLDEIGRLQLELLYARSNPLGGFQ